MIYLLFLFLLTALQFAIGFGIMTLLRILVKRGLFLPLCLLTGVAVFSLIPFLLQLLYIPISFGSVFGSLTFVMILVNLRLRQGIRRLRHDWQNARYSLKLYEIPALLVITAIVLISVWRCFYLPPTPRDLNSGAEAIAEFATHEGTMINSVFSVDVSNNVFKPSSITSLQIVYKLARFYFGQLWLSTIFISFIIFLYHALSARIHKIFSGLLIVFMLAIPEFYGYTFMALFDFPNAIYFCCSLFFLFLFFETRAINNLVFSSLLMGIATYFRSETLVFAFLLLPTIIINLARYKTGFLYLLRAGFLFIMPALLLYIISVPVYVNFYLPVGYPVSEQINPDIANLRPFFKRLSDINSQLIFGQSGIVYYSWFFFIFLSVFLIDLLFIRKLNRRAVNWLFAILVVYLGLPLLGYLLPLLDLHHSTKRGFLKIFPLMVLYMGNTQLLVRISEKIYKWERGD